MEVSLPTSIDQRPLQKDPRCPPWVLVYPGSCHYRNHITRLNKAVDNTQETTYRKDLATGHIRTTPETSKISKHALCRTKEVGFENRRKWNGSSETWMLDSIVHIIQKTLSPFPIFLQKLPNFAVMLSSQWYQENCNKGQFIK